VVAENPLDDLKVLYGTGAIRVTPDNKVVRTGGVVYTIKDGIFYDAKQLLADEYPKAIAALRQKGRSPTAPRSG